MGNHDPCEEGFSDDESDILLVASLLHNSCCVYRDLLFVLLLPSTTWVF